MTVLLNNMSVAAPLWRRGASAYRRSCWLMAAKARRCAFSFDDVFVSVFDNPALAPLEDQARFPLAELSRLGDRLTWFAGREIFALNLVSGPGAGKTTLLGRTVRELQPIQPFYVTECDQATTQPAHPWSRSILAAVVIWMPTWSREVLPS
jgi:hypothetical protein